MSRNKEIKFVKWWEENILDEYRNEKYNYFLDDEWFNFLPKDLKEIILKIDNSSLEDDNYDSYLEELEMEIKDFIFERKHGNYENEEVEYLFEFMGFSEMTNNDDLEEE